MFRPTIPHRNKPADRPRTGVTAVFAVALMAAGGSSACADTLTRTVKVDAAPEVVWSQIGPFCAIQAWHPAIGTCTENGASPPVRTLVTKDGATTFVEPQTARTGHSYSYTFVGKPFPVTHYNGTISVAAHGAGGSTITWHGVYTPDAGKAKDAEGAFAGIYESGLAALKTKFAK